MKNNLVRKVIEIAIAVVFFMYLLSKIVLADTAQIDLNSFENMTSTTQNTINNTAVQQNNSTNTATKTNSTVTSDSKKLPQTGSNNEIVFVIGIGVLVGTAVVIYKKTKI